MMVAVKEFDLSESGLLTVNEAADLAGVSVRMIEKATEENVVPKVSRGKSAHRVKAARVPFGTVAYVRVLKSVKGVHFNKTTKRELFKVLEEQREDLGDFEIFEGLTLSISKLAETVHENALRYVISREAHLTSDDEILGGEPIIKGTRITCRSVLGRVDGGDTIDDLCEDYGDIPREAFEAALIFARTHPPRGRPKVGKPWHSKS
jgi:uncharacterized protein (DUF433 family)